MPKGFLLDNPGIPGYIREKLLIRGLKNREKKSLMRTLSVTSAVRLFIVFSLMDLAGCDHQKNSHSPPATSPPASDYENPVKTQILSLNKRYENMDVRISEDRKKIEALEKQLASLDRPQTSPDASRAPTPTGTTPAPSKSVPRKKPEKKATAHKQTRPPPDPESLYKMAYQEYTQRNYQGAIGHFQEFLSYYPSSALANNALYWIGESYYDQGNLPKAISTFLGVVDRFPQGSKAPDALLKVGISHVKLREPQKAKELFTRVMDEYPFSDAAKEAKVRLDQMRQ